MSGVTTTSNPGGASTRGVNVTVFDATEVTVRCTVVEPATDDAPIEARLRFVASIG